MSACFDTTDEKPACRPVCRLRHYVAELSLFGFRCNALFLQLMVHGNREESVMSQERMLNFIAAQLTVVIAMLGVGLYRMADNSNPNHSQLARPRHHLTGPSCCLQTNRRRKSLDTLQFRVGRPVKRRLPSCLCQR